MKSTTVLWFMMTLKSLDSLVERDRGGLSRIVGVPGCITGLRYPQLPAPNSNRVVHIKTVVVASRSFDI